MKKVFNLLHSVRKWYWKTFKIKTFGVRVLIKKDDSVFLVKHRYGDLWVFPGGGVKKEEPIEQAAKREVYEETNISISTFERVLGVYKNTQGGKNDTVTVIVAGDWTECSKKKWSLEILESGFFNRNNLPKGTSNATRRRIEEYYSGIQKDFSGIW